MTMLAPVESLEDLWKLEFVEADKPEDKMCSFKSHDPEVKATSEMVCLACGKFVGYACASHEAEIVAVMDRNRKGHWIRCAHCQARNMITFFPIGS